MVQWFRHHTSNAGGPGSIPGWGTGFHMPQLKVCMPQLKVLCASVRLFATPRTVAYQAPPSIGFSRQEGGSGLPFPSPGDLPDLGIELRSPALQADSLPSEPPGKPN